eukprot:9358874-Pyramimonas_sp.AAC.3
MDPVESEVKGSHVRPAHDHRVVHGDVGHHALVEHVVVMREPFGRLLDVRGLVAAGSGTYTASTSNPSPNISSL